MRGNDSRRIAQGAVGGLVIFLLGSTWIILDANFFELVDDGRAFMRSDVITRYHGDLRMVWQVGWEIAMADALDLQAMFTGGVKKHFSTM